MTLTRPTRLLLVVSLVTLTAACAPKAVKKPDTLTGAPASQTSNATSAANEESAALDAAARAAFEPGTLFYTLDSALLDAPSRTKLETVAEHLRKVPHATVRISGHTCELGTTEYNLALGHRRARAAMDYLARLGVDAARISTVSFGEEQPADPADHEDAYAQNRRSELTVDLAGPTAQVH